MPWCCSVCEEALTDDDFELEHYLWRSSINLVADAILRFNCITEKGDLSTINGHGERLEILLLLRRNGVYSSCQVGCIEQSWEKGIWFVLNPNARGNETRGRKNVSRVTPMSEQAL